MFNVIDLFRKLLPAKVEQPSADEGEDLPIGDRPDPEREAIVIDAITPRRTGQVEYRGSLWTARSRQNVTLEPGEIVYVVNRKHVTTLYVVPDPFAVPIPDVSDTVMTDSAPVPDLSDTAMTDPAAKQRVCQNMIAINQKLIPDQHCNISDVSDEHRQQ